MKKKLRKWIQKPLRFHHQDIHEELDLIKCKMNRIEELLTFLVSRGSSR